LTNKKGSGLLCGTPIESGRAPGGVPLTRVGAQNGAPAEAENI